MYHNSTMEKGKMTIVNFISTELQISTHNSGLGFAVQTQNKDGV